MITLHEELFSGSSEEFPEVRDHLYSVLPFKKKKKVRGDAEGPRRR